MRRLFLLLITLEIQNLNVSSKLRGLLVSVFKISAPPTGTTVFGHDFDQVNSWFRRLLWRYIPNACENVWPQLQLAVILFYVIRKSKAVTGGLQNVSDYRPDHQTRILWFSIWVWSHHMRWGNTYRQSPWLWTSWKLWTFFQKGLLSLKRILQKGEENTSCWKNLDLQIRSRSFFVHDSSTEATELARKNPKFPWGPKLEALTVLKCDLAYCRGRGGRPWRRDDPRRREAAHAVPKAHGGSLSSGWELGSVRILLASRFNPVGGWRVERWRQRMRETGQVRRQRDAASVHLERHPWSLLEGQLFDPRPSG